MVETRGYTLEEVAFAFDGPNMSLSEPFSEQHSYEETDKTAEDNRYKS